MWENPASFTPSIIQVLFGPWGENIPGDGLQYCGPTATLMGLYYLYNNGFLQVAPAPYGGQDDPDATNLELVLGGLMGTSSVGGTAGGMAIGVSTYLSACGISTDEVTFAQSSTPDLAWFQTALALNVASNPDAIVLANFGVSWFTLDSGTTYTRTGGHFLAPLTVQQSAGTLTLNNSAPTTFGGTRSPSSNPQTVTIEAVSGLTLKGVPPGNYSQVITSNLGPSHGYLAVLTGADAWTIKKGARPVSGHKPKHWHITQLQGISTNGGLLTVKAPVKGLGGISMSGEGTLVFANTNELTGPMGAAGGILASTQAAGAPFGTGPMGLSGGGILQFSPDGTATIASAQEATCAFGPGGGILQPAGSASYTLTIGGYTNGQTPNLNRLSAGTLAIAPGAGLAELGSSQQVLVAGSGGNLPAVSNGIVAPYIIGMDNDSAGSGGFLTYDAGFQAAVSVSSAKVGISKVTSDMVYEVVDQQTIDGTGSTQVAALEMNGGEIDGGDGSLLIGSQQSGDVAGVIMNGGNINVGSLFFGEAEGVIYTNDGGLSTGIYSAIAGSAGLTVFGPGALVLAADNAASLTGPITVNSGTLIAGNSWGSSTGADNVTVCSGATLQVSGTVAGAVDVQQSGTLTLDNGIIQGAVTIAPIGQTSAEPGGILQGSGTIAGTADIGGVIQCGPVVGTITFANDVTISSDTAIYWQLQGPVDNSTQDSGPGIGWNALLFQANSIIGSSANSSVRVFLDFSVIGGDPDSGANAAFWQSDHTWTLAAFEQGASSCWVTHGNFTYNSGCFCVCVCTQSSTVTLNLLWKPGETSQKWCQPSS